MKALIHHTLDQAGPLGSLERGRLTTLAKATGLVTPESVKTFTQVGAEVVDKAVDAFARANPDAGAQRAALEGLNDLRQALYVAEGRYAQSVHASMRTVSGRVDAYNHQTLPGLEGATRLRVKDFAVPVDPKNPQPPHQTFIKSGHRVATAERAGEDTFDWNMGVGDSASEYRLLDNVDALMYYCIGSSIGGPTGAAITQLVQEKQPKSAGWILASADHLPYTQEELVRTGRALSQGIKTATLGRGKDICINAQSVWTFSRDGIIGDRPVNYTEPMYDFSAEFPYQWNNSRLVERIPGQPAIVTTGLPL
ncbi:MAG TPA: hypothetical protein VGO93_04095 [Candidatus Xenobia bacterium]|jgi:hypothetical protein